MQKIRTILYTGGEIHDWRGVGTELNRILKSMKELQLSWVKDDLDILKAGNLRPFELMVFFHTVGSLTSAQKNGLLNWVAKGNGFVGIHSAADSFRDCPEYRAMVGGHFVTHPHYRDYMVSVLDAEHPITEGLSEFMVRDEQYITDYDPRNHVLATALWQGIARPVAWVKSWGEGRVFYLALGHDQQACKHEMFELLLRRGCLWAAGKLGESETAGGE